MLTKEENEILCRVGPGTPTGELLRHYWLPFLRSSELPEPDGPPLRVRLLGEDLIAFRDTTGRVGLLGNHCPHRGASLFFARNEEHGLRCVYHGWKYDVAGRCVDMPNEPAGRWTHSGGRDSIESSTSGAPAEPAGRWTHSGGRDSLESSPSEAQAEARSRPFSERIQHLAYPCRERGGVVWAYMGPRADPPPLPDLPWFLVPDDHRFVSKRLEQCNWVQAFEGGIDSSHSSFLHSRLNPEQYEDLRGTYNRKVMLMKQRDRHPLFETVDSDFGVWVAARRDADDDRYLWRMTPFLMPFYTMTPGNEIVTEIEDRSRGGHAWVPMDDEHTITWSFTCRFTRPFSEQELGRLNSYPSGSGIHVGVPGGVLPPTSVPMGAWRPVANRSNDYLLDREAQRTRLFFGVLNLAMQDQAVQESMGPIYDRTQEHLGSSDLGIIRVRQRLMEAAKALAERGQTPPGVDQPEAYRVQSAVMLASKGVPWLEAAKDYLVAEPGVHYQPAATAR